LPSRSGAVFYNGFGYVQVAAPPADPNIPPIGSGSLATPMSIASGLIRATVVEGVSAELSELVVGFAEPFNRLLQVFLQTDATSGMQGSYRVEGGQRYLAQDQMGMTLRLNPSYTLPGTYRGTAMLQACEGWYATGTGLPYCGHMYSNASGSVPYEIVVREITTTFTPVNDSYFPTIVGRLTTDVPVNVPYGVKAFASPPFLGANLAPALSGAGYELSVTVPPGMPRGTVVTGNVLIRVCRDIADTCAQPRQGSPFNVTVSYTVR
jgi:hypothetical protein